MKKKAGRTYMTTRAQYKNAKKYDHAQFDAFCTGIYAEGYQDGRDSVPGANIRQVMAAIQTVKGIGEKRLGQIEAAVSGLFSEPESVRGGVNPNDGTAQILHGGGAFRKD